MRRWAPLPTLLLLGGCFDFASLLSVRDRPDFALGDDGSTPIADAAQDAERKDWAPPLDATLAPPPDGGEVDAAAPDAATGDLAAAPGVDLTLLADALNPPPDVAVAPPPPDMATVDLDVPDLWRGDLARPDMAKTEVRTYRLAATPSDVRPVDVDGDGDLDVVVACYLARQVVTLLNDGAGTLTPAAGGPLVANSGTGYFAEPRDYTGDGKVDVVVTLASSQVLLAAGRGDGTFTTADIFNLPGAPTGIAAGDFNRDRLVDVAVAVLAQTPGVLVLDGQAKGLAAPGRLQAYGSYLAPLAAADLDRDGIVDLVAGNTSPATTILVLPGRGDGTFRSSISLGVQPIQGIVPADVDVDGTLDLVVGDPAQRGFAVLRGTGNFGFDAPVRTMSMGMGQAHVAVGDLMKSGAPDVVVAENVSDDVAVFKGKNGLQPRYRATYGTGRAPTVVRLADLDADGHLDIITGDKDGSSVTVVLAP